MTRPSLPLGLARQGSRATAALSRRVRGGSGLVIGGRVLLAARPSAVAELSHGRRTTLISGTNGKTTTTGLVAAALGGTGRVGTNREGANTSAGIAGTLGSTTEARMALEVDEGWLPWAVRQTSPVSVVLGNLSRDQLSRHHEVGAIARTWRGALDGVPLAIANCDDPDVVWPAMAAREQVWVAAGQTWTADSLVCPRCGGRCRHEGVGWECTSCGLQRPEPDWWIDDRVVHHRDGAVALEIDLPGRFNVGNAALALAAAGADGVPADEAARRLAALGSIAGRFERIRTGGHDLRMMLAKNPAGWMELLTLMEPDAHPVVLLFNAEGVDGRDPSWLYDVPFDGLRSRRVLVQGRRATDLAVRLEMDGVEADTVPGGLAAALRDLPPGRVDVVGNYTAFQAARAELTRG